MLSPGIRRALGRMLGRARSEHHDEEVSVVELVRERGSDGALADATFTGCLIVGPAVLVVGDGFDLIENVIEGGADAFLWPVEQGRERVLGAVLATRCAFRGCTFRGCTFRNVGFAAPATVIERIRANIDERVDEEG